MTMFALTSFFITIILVLLICPAAKAIGLTDKPNNRKHHSGEIPLIGGVCIFTCILLLTTWLPINDFWFLVSASIIVLCGVIDDYKHLHHKTRLSVEVIATVIMIYGGGVEITNLGNLFGFGNIYLGYLSPFVTIFAVLGGINAFNMTDGIDGSTAGLSLIALGLVLMVAANAPQISTICILFIPAILAFLFFNMRIFGRKKASVFLGDAGSMLLGFTICYLVILISQGENRIISPVTVLWIIALPLLDAICIMTRRYQKGVSVFSPDREHFHHILPLAGYTMNQTLSIILFISLILGSFGILGEKFLKLPEWLMFSLFLGLFLLYYWGISHAWKVMKVTRSLHTNQTSTHSTLKN